MTLSHITSKLHRRGRRGEKGMRGKEGGEGWRVRMKNAWRWGWSEDMNKDRDESRKEDEGNKVRPHKYSA